MICSPMVMTGLSEYFGSCITIVMRPPRRSRNFRLDAVRRSVPSKAKPLCRHLARRRRQPEDGAARLGLAGAGFPDDSEPLAAKRERHAAHGLHDSGAQMETYLQIFDLEKRGGAHLAAFGSSTSRSPSPRRLKPRLTMKMARPGMAATHH